MADTKLTPITVLSPKYDLKRSSTYGGDCSDFALFTYTTNGNKEEQIALYGVLSELPTFSMNISITDGPCETISEKMTKYMCGDIMNVVNAIGAVSKNGNNGFKNLIPTGGMTKRIYDGVDYSGLDLKFKVYKDFIPGVSSASTWISNLSKYATINNNNNMNAGSLVANIKAAGQNIKACGEKVAVLNMSDDENTDDMTTREGYAAKIDKIDATVTTLNNQLRNLVAALNSTTKYKNLISELVVEGHQEWLHPIDQDFEYCLHVTLAKDTKAWSKGVKHSLESDGDIEYDEFNDGARIFRFFKNASLEEIKNGDALTDNFTTFFSSPTDNCITKLLNAYYLKTEPEQNALEKLIKDNDNDVAKILSEICNTWEKDTTKTLVERFRDSNVIQMFKEIEKEVAVTRYNPGRVQGDFNIANALGAKLWNLRIFPWLFASSIPVYIKSWNYKKSNEGVYTEFNVSCYFDQVYSREIWKFYFDGILPKH